MEKEDKIGLTIAYIGVILITLIGIVSADTMYSGETKIIEFSDIVKDCEIINNQFDLEGLNFTEFENTVIISTQPNYKPDNFTISCLVRGFREEKDPYSGGSPSYYRPKEEANETDDINDLRKQLLEKQMKEQEDKVNPIGGGQYQPIIDESEEKSNLFKDNLILIISIIILIVAFISYLIVRKKNS